MNLDKAKIAFKNYVDAATDLAEAVKDRIQHDGIITDDIVLKLNTFIIASNAIADLPFPDENDTNDDINETNNKLN